MSPEAGPGPRSKAQKKQFYRQQGKSDRGGRGGGRGGRGGRGGFGGGRGGVPAGPHWEAGSEGPRGKRTHMGRYRDDPLPEILTGPGICATAVQNKERTAERELVEVLEEVADELYPETKAPEVKQDLERDGDLEALLQQELADMTDDKKSERFRLCRHDTACVIYVNFLPPLDPILMVRRVLERVEETGKCPFKFIRRIIPISAVSNATIASLVEIARPLVAEAFEGDEPLTFSVVPNKRNTAKLDSMEMIKTLAQEILTLEKGHKVNLKNPDRTVLVEVYKNTLGMSIVPEYERNRRYNPVQLAEHLASVRSKDASAGETPSDIITSDQPGHTVVLQNADNTPSRGQKVLEQRKRRAEEMAAVHAETRAAPVGEADEEAAMNEVDGDGRRKAARVE